MLVWRHVPTGHFPWEVSTPPSNGRWQRGSTVAALYFSDTEETAIAESRRLIRELGAIPEGFLPRDLWTAEIDTSMYVDLRDPNTAKLYNLPASLKPTRAEWPSCQPIGERIAGEGHHGLIAPSAAHPAGFTVAVFPLGHSEIAATAKLIKTLDAF